MSWIKLKILEEALVVLYMLHTLALIILCSPPSHAHDAHDARPGDQSARRMKGKEIKFSPLPSSSRQRSASLQQSLYFETLSTFSFQYIIIEYIDAIGCCQSNSPASHPASTFSALGLQPSLFQCALSNRLQVDEVNVLFQHSCVKYRTGSTRNVFESINCILLSLSSLLTLKFNTAVLIIISDMQLMKRLFKGQWKKIICIKHGINFLSMLSFPRVVATLHAKWFKSFFLFLF